MTPSASRSRREEPAARQATSRSSIRVARGVAPAGCARRSLSTTGVNATLRRSCVAAAFIALVTEARSCTPRLAIPASSIRTRWVEP